MPLFVFRTLFFITIFYIAFPGAAQAVEPKKLPDKKTMQLCSKPEDCTYATSPCGSKEAVNILYQNALQEKFDKAGESLDCIWYDKREVTQAYCLAARCHLILKQPE